jgi:MerR family transcriptional regulator, light-induced transcriptional regulator
VVRSILHSLRSTLSGLPDAPAVVVATPAGEQHEIGALLAAAAAAAAGWRVVYLGVDLPAEEIAEAAIQTRARAVAVSVIFSERLERPVTQVTLLREALPPEIALLLGGGMAQRHRAAFTQPGVDLVPGIEGLTERLGQLR